jgi:hypothetical protein
MQNFPYLNEEALVVAQNLARKKENLSKEEIIQLAPALFRHDAETFLRENRYTTIETWQKISRDSSVAAHPDRSVIAAFDFIFG